MFLTFSLFCLFQVVEKGNTVKPKDKKEPEVDENRGGDVPMHVMADMDQATFGEVNLQPRNQ